MKYLLLIAMVVPLIGCASQMVMYRDPYPAKSPDTEIEIYNTQTVDRPYTEIGEIKANAIGGDTANIRVMKKRARKVGADAIIITGKNSVVATYTGSFAIAQETGMKGIAIKYK